MEINHDGFKGCSEYGVAQRRQEFYKIYPFPHDSHLSKHVCRHEMNPMMTIDE